MHSDGPAAWTVLPAAISDNFSLSDLQGSESRRASTYSEDTLERSSGQERKSSSSLSRNPALTTGETLPVANFTLHPQSHSLLNSPHSLTPPFLQPFPLSLHLSAPVPSSPPISFQLYMPPSPPSIPDSPHSQPIPYPPTVRIHLPYSPIHPHSLPAK